MHMRCVPQVASLAAAERGYSDMLLLEWEGGGGEGVSLTGKGGSSTSESSTTPALALSYQHGMQFSKLSIFYANSHTFQPLPRPHFSALSLAPFSKVQTVTPSGG